MDNFRGTPGPWRWEVNLKDKDINLVGGIPKYDLTVMDFVLYGTGGAAPRFNTTHKSGLNIMERAETLVEIVPGREHHSHWFQTLNHPDACLIAAAPDLLAALQDLWIRSTNLFGELTIDEVKADVSLHGLDLAITKAKQVISKALGTEV